MEQAMLELTPPSLENPSSSPPDLCGRFVIVTYDELPYVGQVLKVVEEELHISCMRQSGDKNLFLWPQTLDVTFYLRKDRLGNVQKCLWLKKCLQSKPSMCRELGKCYVMLKC